MGQITNNSIRNLADSLSQTIEKAKAAAFAENFVKVS